MMEWEEYSDSVHQLMNRSSNGGLAGTLQTARCMDNGGKGFIFRLSRNRGGHAAFIDGDNLVRAKLYAWQFMIWHERKELLDAADGYDSKGEELRLAADRLVKHHRILLP